MSDQNLPTIQQRGSITPSMQELQVYELYAKKLSDSKYFQSLGGEAGIIAIMLLGRELGLQPMQSVSGGLTVIQGRVELSARLMNMLIRQAGHSLKIVESTNTKCRIAGKRRDTGEEYTAEFTMEQARKARLTKDGGMFEKYAEDMLFARCISRLGRRLFPDVIANCYVEGEIRDAVDVEYSTVPEQPIHVDQPPTKPVDSPDEPPVTPPVELPKQTRVQAINRRFAEYMDKHNVPHGVRQQLAIDITCEFDCAPDEIDESCAADLREWYELKGKELLRKTGLIK